MKMRALLLALAALLAARPAGAAELRYILQDLRCLPLTRSVMGNGDCPVEQNSVVIAGSTAMMFYTRLLAAEFEKRNPGVKVEVSGGNSIAGLIAVDRGAIDLAAVSRDLVPKEYRAELKVTMIGRDGLVAVVNRANPLSDLSRQQLRAIFLGGEKVVETAHSAKGSEALVAAVNEDPDAIGFVGLHGLSPEVKALTIDGVPVSDATILSSRYPLVRSLNLVEWGDEGGGPKRRFVDFAKGPDGQALIEKAGAVRVE